MISGSKPQPQAKQGPIPHSGNPACNSSHLLDKHSARRATPDSEALTSSDDEADGRRGPGSIPLAPPQKPARRASWLNDTTQISMQTRKGSFVGASMSPTTSHPNTPSADSGVWVPQSALPGAASNPRGNGATPSFPWGQGIWNAESRKEVPSRFSDVLTPTTQSGGNKGAFGPDTNTLSVRNAAHDRPSESNIPFTIPLHPTPKTYRSQSYSVGQMDSERSPSGYALPSGTQISAGRTRGLHANPLQHRSSRPSMVSEVEGESTSLSALEEVGDNDREGLSEGLRGLRMTDQSMMLEALARENAMLRQQNMQNARLRPRSTTNLSLSGFTSAEPYPLRDALPEESDSAIDEMDDTRAFADRDRTAFAGRRLSELSFGNTGRITSGSAENRALENVKKAYWQSSLGFNGLPDIPQSRRHSFAEVPTRHASVGSIGDQIPRHEAIHNDQAAFHEETPTYGGSVDNYPIGDHVASYFGGSVSTSRNPETYGSMAYPNSNYSAFAINSAYALNGSQPHVPHRNVYSMPQPRQNQPLYIVLFKCSRADVFYVQEGTGLSVKPGDLVIVEADRGTDLGTVAHDNVDWVQAKELKEHYAEEHYKWLMMYSQGAMGTADGTGAGLMAAANGLQGSAVGGMGPPSQHGLQEPTSGDLKPKIIKRLAQTHEIQALRDKEGNEAKAKRVCMQKVKEHGLHMEILDAEFQMDWKKLTFYYFADAYINFNSLVTDLFKVYKTRIWMSAINPASFASPALGLQAPSGVGPGAVGANRQPPSDRRQPLQQEQTVGSPLSAASRAFGSATVESVYSHADNGKLSSGYMQQSPFGLSSFAGAATNMHEDYQPHLMQQPDTFVPMGTNYYGGLSGRFLSGQAVSQPDHGAFGRQGEQHDQWPSAFQGLALNGR